MIQKNMIAKENTIDLFTTTTMVEEDDNDETAPQNNGSVFLDDVNNMIGASSQE